MRSLVLRAAIVALAILALPGFASAQFMTAFTGNVLFNSPTAADTSTVNYTVYNNANGDFSTSSATSVLRSGLSSAAVTALNADNYIYIYQVVAQQANGVDQLQVAQPQNFVYKNSYSAISSSGDGIVFKNNFQIAGGSPVFATDSSATDFASFDYGGHFNGNSSELALNGSFSSLGSSGNSFYTNVMVAGSMIAPALGDGGVNDGGHADGLLPVPGPEPSTIGLLALGLPVFGFGYSRRLRALVARKTAMAAA